MMGSVELCSRAGITTRQLHHWVTSGYLLPDTTEGTPAGSGHPVQFTSGEAEVARQMGLLVSAGVLPGAAHQAARQLATSGTATLGSFTITPLAGAA